MAKRYDAIIIGTGQAGPPLAEKLAGGLDEALPSSSGAGSAAPA